MRSPGRSLAAAAAGRALRIADGDMELPSSTKENTLAWSSYPLGNNTKRGEAKNLKSKDIPKVRKKRFFLDSNGLNLASLFVVDIFPTGIKPTNLILLRLTVKVED